jgi:uncharacterized membrane protein
MNRMLVAVLDDEAAAYEGKGALMQLEAEGSITLYASAVIAMRPDGTVAIRDQDAGPLGSLAGGPLGSLIALIGGPIRFSIGVGTSLATGMLVDLENARIGGDFVDDVRRELTPGRAAVVAEVDEGWTAPVDSRLENLGCTVLRRSMSEVRHAANEAEIVAIKADIMQTEAEAAQAPAERRATLQARLDRLESRLEEKLQRGRRRREAIRNAARARVAVLRRKASGAQRKQC